MPSFGEIMETFLSTVEMDCGKKEVDLFHGTHGKNGKKFQNQLLSINMIGSIGKDIAEELGLVNPKEYTGNNYIAQILTSFWIYGTFSFQDTHSIELQPDLQQMRGPPFLT